MQVMVNGANRGELDSFESCEKFEVHSPAGSTWTCRQRLAHVLTSVGAVLLGEESLVLPVPRAPLSRCQAAAAFDMAEPSCSSCATSSPCKPWWDKMARYQLCAEKTSSQIGCSYHTYVSTQCREDKDANGHPVRHCIRHSKRYEDCGRGRELVEESREDVTDPHIDRTLRASNLQEPFSAGEIPPRPQQALDSRLGEALEEVMLSAQDYRHLVSRPDEESKKGREKNGSQLPLTDLPQPSKSYFSLPSLFWSATAGAKSRELSPGRKQQRDTWDQYAKDFQEV